MSWHHHIETVPTLIRVDDGAEVERTVGWSRADWQRITGLDGLGEDLPVMRPGCGSLSVDPDRIDELRVRFEGGRLRSRRVELAELEDDIEAMFTKGWTDGLPVVPPTESRVLRMLEGTTRQPDEIVATVPPDLVDVTVEKVAIAAVMAGCLPEYLPWVLTVVEAVCTDEFNIHGVLATTMPVGPVIVASGPGTRAIGMNSGVNVLGPGQPRQLDDRPGRATGRAQRRRRPPGRRRPGDARQPRQALVLLRRAPRLAVRHARREPRRVARRGCDHRVRRRRPALRRRPEVAGTGEPGGIAGGVACGRSTTPSWCWRSTSSWWSAPSTGGCSPRPAGTAPASLGELDAALQIPGYELVGGAGGIAEGIPEAFADATLPKFRPDGILLVYAGGGAGLFSAIIGGWANGAVGSQPVTREVRR